MRVTDTSKVSHVRLGYPWQWDPSFSKQHVSSVRQAGCQLTLQLPHQGHQCTPEPIVPKQSCDKLERQPLPCAMFSRIWGASVFIPTPLFSMGMACDLAGTSLSGRAHRQIPVCALNATSPAVMAATCPPGSYLCLHTGQSQIFIWYIWVAFKLGLDPMLWRTHWIRNYFPWVIKDYSESSKELRKIDNAFHGNHLGFCWGRKARFWSITPFSQSAKMHSNQ